jgi:hypothetical protein
MDRPQEDVLLRGRGMMFDWIGSGWLVVETPEAQAARGAAPHPSLAQANEAAMNAAAAIVNPQRAGEGGAADPVFTADVTNPIGSWLVGVEQQVNEKLARYNLRGRIVLDLTR